MLTIAIFAGGKSERMGKEKATMPFKGNILIRHVIERIEDLADEIIIIGNVSQDDIKPGIRIIPDKIPGHGPLGGLFTALYTASNPVVAAVGCDMPFVSPDLFAYQIENLISNNVDVVVPTTSSGLEPLHSVYRKENCLLPVKEAMERGENRLISWFPRVKLQILSLEEILPFDPFGRIFMNINTPEEFTLAEKLV